MILVDTSVWIGHLRRADPHLVELLEAGEVVTHPMVIGALACGTLPERETRGSRRPPGGCSSAMTRGPGDDRIERAA